MSAQLIVKNCLKVLLISGIVWLPSCKDKTPDPVLIIRDTTANSREVLIANQGNFGWGEGTLSLYEAYSKTVQNDIYKTINQESLGNVFQSVSRLGENYYFVINNSGKIVVTDTEFTKKVEINGFNSPRYLYEVQPGKAYVTDLYAKAIAIVNLTTNTITGSIPTGTYTDKGVLRDGIFWCTAPDADKIYGINVLTDALVDSFSTGVNPDGIVVDKNNYIRILCKGGGATNDLPKLMSFTEANGQKYPVGYVLSPTPTGLAYNSNLDILYFCTEKGIWRGIGDMQTGSAQLWIEAEGAIFYAIGIDPKNGDIYVSDVKDFVSKSAVKRYSSDGILLDEFTVGIIAGDFFFP